MAMEIEIIDALKFTDFIYISVECPVSYNAVAIKEYVFASTTTTIDIENALILDAKNTLTGSNGQKGAIIKELKGSKLKIN